MRLLTKAMQCYEWLYNLVLIPVQTISQAMIYHSKQQSIIQLHIQRANNRLQIKVLTHLTSVTVITSTVKARYLAPRL